MAIDDGQEAPGRLPVVARSTEERLGVALDGGERRAQLVRDVGHEIAPDDLEPPELGDVVQHEHEAEGLAVGVRAAGRRSPAASGPCRR